MSEIKHGAVCRIKGVLGPRFIVDQVQVCQDTKFAYAYGKFIIGNNISNVTCVPVKALEPIPDEKQK